MVEERLRSRLAAILAVGLAGRSRPTGRDERFIPARRKPLRAEAFDRTARESDRRIVKNTENGARVGYARAVVRTAMLALSVAALFGCVLVGRPTEDPIPVRIHGDIGTADRVYVLLPGFADDLDSFEERGFLDIARTALDGRVRAAFVAVDAHIGYYRNGEIVRRLEDQVLDRYVAGRPVTGVGVSMGGLGVLSTARRHPERFERIVLFAPYLGDREDVTRFANAKAPPPGDNREHEVNAVWKWLAGGADGVSIALLYGRDDRSRPAFEYLAKRAPRIEMRRIDGAHNWRTWNALWRQLLTRR